MAKPDQWTPADEANYQDLTERRERITTVKRRAVREVLDAMSWDSDDEYVDVLIAYAQELRDALAPFDSGVRCAEPAPDRWIEWGGGECPVDASTIVLLRLRSGVLEHWKASGFDWAHDGSETDVLSYRVVIK